MRLLSGCQYLTIFFSFASLALHFQKHQVFIFEQSNPKPSFLHHKTRVFIVIQLFMQPIYFCLLYSIIWLKEGRIPYFEYSWKFNNRSWSYNGKIMDFYFVFSVGTVLPLPGAIYIWWNIKKMYIKSDFKAIFLNLQQMGKVIRAFCWHQTFVPKGLSALAPGLYKNIKSLKCVLLHGDPSLSFDKNKKIFQAVQDFIMKTKLFE